ncbi:MAG: AMMECR1 domain-containing protein [Deltaproteobacteria bacterium]|nr:AMMECR1 domain-containing protein [Deltaproteobacteria bacterium]
MRTARLGSASAPVVNVDGEAAPWALDLLRATLDHDGATVAARALLARLATFYGRQLATFGVGGLPLLQSCLMLDRRLRGLVIRKERRPYGARTQIEGELDPSQPVVIVDDASASGWSLVRAYELLEEHGLFVEGAVVLVRFGFNPGIAYLVDRGVRVESVLDLWTDLAGLLPGTAPVDDNPTAELPALRFGRARFPAGLHPAVLARRVIEARLAGRPLPLPPRALANGPWHAEGGVFVSVRPRSDVTDRHARDGFFRFPEDHDRLPADPARAVVLAAAKTAEALVGGAGDGAGGQGAAARALADAAVAVTFCGRLQRTTIGGVDNERYGLVARSMVRRGFLGGALPRMPGIADDAEQLRHAHTTNARLFRREPYQLYRHAVVRAVEPGMPWHSAGVPRQRPPWHERFGPLLALLARAAAAGEAPPALDVDVPAHLDSLYVTVLQGGRVRGCSGGVVQKLGGDVAAHARAAAADARFDGTPSGVLAVSVSLLWEPTDLGVATAEDAAFRLRAGRHAVMVDDGERAALLLPLVASRSALDELSFVEAALDKAGLDKDAAVRVTRFSCASYGADDRGVAVLDGGLPRAPAARARQARPSRAALAGRIARLADYLEQAQRPDGNFHLEHLPAIGARLGTAEPPRVAHAAWVLLRAGRPHAARRALHALTPLIESDGACAWLREPTEGAPSISAVALLLLALCEEQRPPPAPARALVASLLAAIDDTGRMRTHRGGAVVEEARDLFPPQALLALGRAHARGVAGIDVERVQRALVAAHIRFRHRPTIGQVPWLAQAAHAWRASTPLRSVVRALGDDVARFVLDRQQESGAVLYPPSAPLGLTTVLALEGLAALAGVTRGALHARVLRACGRALPFLDRLTLHERDLAWLADGPEALGGVRESLLDVRLRIDFTQHALAALLSLADARA